MGEGHFWAPAVQTKGETRTVEPRAARRLLTGRPRTRALLCSAVVCALAMLAASGLPAKGPAAPTVARAALPGRILFGHLGEVWSTEGGTTSQVTDGGRYWGQPDLASDGRIALVG